MESFEPPKLISLSDLVTIKPMEIKKETIVFSPKVREWCKLGKVCPNYGTSPSCPPNAPYRKEILDQYTHFVLVHATFDLGAFKASMQAQHPDWSEKMCGNSRYWQKGVKAMMRDWIKDKHLPYDDLLGCGSGFMGKQSQESAGIFVLRMYHRNRIPYEVKPRRKVVLSALLMSKERKKPARSTNLDEFR